MSLNHEPRRGVFGAKHAGKKVNKDIVCFKCETKGHVAHQCKANSYKSSDSKDQNDEKKQARAAGAANAAEGSSNDSDDRKRVHIATVLVSTSIATRASQPISGGDDIMADSRASEHLVNNCSAMHCD